MVDRLREAGKLRGGRKLVAPELLEVRAAPSSGVAALMVGAAWFGFGEQTEDDRSKQSHGHDPFWDLLGAAYLTDQTFHVPRSISRPDPLAQFSVGFSTRPVEGVTAGSTSSAQLEAAHERATDMIVRAVDRLSHGSARRRRRDGLALGRAGHGRLERHARLLLGRVVHLHAG